MAKLPRNLGGRFWVEAVGASLTGLLLIVTLISMEWIEIVFGVDPDNHSGSLEIGLILACAAATCVLSLMARYDWQRAVRLPAAQQ